MYSFFFFFFSLSIYWICYNTASVSCLFCFGQETWVILAPQTGIEPASPALEGKVSTTGLPGKPHCPQFPSRFSDLIPWSVSLSLAGAQRKKVKCNLGVHEGGLGQVNPLQKAQGPRGRAVVEPRSRPQPRHGRQARLKDRKQHWTGASLITLSW